MIADVDTWWLLLECDHIFTRMSTLPPSHCPKCGKYLGKQPETRITC